MKIHELVNEVDVSPVSNEETFKYPPYASPLRITPKIGAAAPYKIHSKQIFMPSPSSYSADAKIVRPFMCPVCSLAFTRKADAKRHIQSMHGERFPCKDCTKTFNRKDTYNNHVKRFHPFSSNDKAQASKLENRQASG